MNQDNLSRAARWGIPLGFFVYAGLLALPGLVPQADHMTFRVLTQVAEIPWERFHQPFTNPPPMESSGVRPMSVAALKVFNDLYGLNVFPSEAVRWWRSTLSLWIFGVGGWAWLRVYRFPRYTVLAPALSMLLAPALFSAWYFPEFDALGAGCTLWVGAVLGARQSPGLFGWLSVLAAGAWSFGLKESAVLMQFAIIGAGMIEGWRRRAYKVVERHLLVVIVAIAIWVYLAIPLIKLGHSPVASVGASSRLPILEHNLDQFVYLLGAPGVVLLLLGAIARLRPVWLGPVAAAAVIGLVAAPIVVFYSHYEAVYYAPRAFPAICSVLLILGLFLGIRRAEPHQQIAGLTVTLVFSLFTAAVISSPTAREDLASRIFLSLAPIFHVLALEGLKRAWGLAGQVGRVPVGLLGAAYAWYLGAGAFNYTQDWRARHRAEFDGREILSRIPLDYALVVFNHYVQQVGAYEFRPFGVPDIRGVSRFYQITAFPTKDRLPAVFWGSRLDVEELASQGRSIYLYWYAARSKMDATANDALRGDLSWTRRGYGLFTPYDYILDSDASIPAEEQPAGMGMPGHNRPEESRLTTYLGEPTPLERQFDRRGKRLWEEELDFYQLPLHLFEVPRRVWNGVPLVESYVYETRIYHLREAAQPTDNPNAPVPGVAAPVPPSSEG